MIAHQKLAPKPPMGWNSWDCFGTSVTEAEVMSNAQYMAENLLRHGWDTVVVDIQWYDPTARAGGYNDNAPVALDGWGRPVPALNRFPSAAGGAGFAPLARRVHELGLRFGVHLMRGIPRRAVEAGLPVLGTALLASDIANRQSTCKWNSDNFGIDHSQPGAQAYYDSIAALFSEWGVDYVKVDDMLGPFHDAEIAAFSRAIREADRAMVFSLSPGVELSTAHAQFLRSHADLWRISNDVWDRWSDIRGQFERIAMWAPFNGEGRWADADMLPLGRIGIRAEQGADRNSRLTADEARTMMTLWVIARSPLMFGGDLPQTDPITLGLLTNYTVLEILSDSTNNRQVVRDGELVVWAADSAHRSRTYAALFNVGETPLAAEIPFSSLGRATAGVATDLWKASATGLVSVLVSVIPPHGCALFAVDEVDEHRGGHSKALAPHSRPSRA